MSFGLTPEQRRLQGLDREMAETFVRGRAAEIDRTEAYPWDNVRELAKAGLTGCTIPKNYGDGAAASSMRY